MKGSEKQIRWAEQIKAGKYFIDLRNRAKSPIAIKILDFVENIDDASFWIKYRNNAPEEMLEEMATLGLQICNKTARYDANGVITITWTKIVQDGKGGHKETRTQTI